MDEVTHSGVLSLARIDEYLIEPLLLGVNKEQLHQVIGLQSGYPPSSPQVDTIRMNVIATLRSVGYIVEGGRSGRGQPYRIVGFEPRAYLPSVGEWSGVPRGVIEFVWELPEITWAWVRGGLVEATPLESTPLAERSWGYINCYERARRNTCYQLQGDTGRAVIIQKFNNYPRLKLQPLSMAMWELLEWGEFLARGSTRPVRVIGLDEDDLQYLRADYPNVRAWSSRTEAVYDTRRIATEYKSILPHRARTYFNRNSREISYSHVWNRAAAITTIDQWREVNQPKHRQLAISRDYVSVEEPSPDGYCFIGFRGHSPCCVHVLDSLPKYPGWVTQIVEKSLNYQTQPGGYPGTSDYNIVTTCIRLAEMGIHHINAGGYDGGGWGLSKHKSVWALPSDDKTSFSFDLPFEFFRG